MDYSMLRKLVMNIVEFRSGLMSAMSASDVAMFSSVLMFPLTKAEVARYKDPLRDMGSCESTIRRLVRGGHSVTLVGKHLYLLMRRLSDPIGFWNVHRGRERLSVWVAIVGPNGARYIHEGEVLPLHGNPTPSRLELVFGPLGREWDRSLPDALLSDVGVWSSVASPRAHRIRLLTLLQQSDRPKPMNGRAVVHMDADSNWSGGAEAFETLIEVVDGTVGTAAVGCGFDTSVAIAVVGTQVRDDLTHLLLSTIVVRDRITLQIERNHGRQNWHLFIPKG